MKLIRRNHPKTLLLFVFLFLFGFGATVDADSLIRYKWDRTLSPQSFSSTYSEIQGVLTFRGTGDRSTPSYGTVQMKSFRPAVIWSKTTRESSWGGGAGWTGQPAIVKWTSDVLQTMNVNPQFRNKSSFTEVIYASLDGSVYFMDLETGEESRKPIKVGNPIKGSVSVDARGYPLLYVGEGIPENGTIGFHLYSLTNQQELFYMKGMDSFSLRKWGAFDGSALFNRYEDTLLVGGENGILYNIKLNTEYDREAKSIAVHPIVGKYRYSIAGNEFQGIENSVAVSGNLAFFADNGGSLQAMDLNTLSPVWSLPSTDDTDATLVLEQEDGVPYLYTGTEVDKQGRTGLSFIRKINGKTGKVIWQMKYPCFSQTGSHPVNGGLLATPVNGKKKIARLVIFTIARYGTFDGGLMVALDKETGNELWRLPMEHYAWSSPVDVYDEQGNGYIVQADSSGTVMVVDAQTGTVKGNVSVGRNVEASPAVFNDYVVVASRAGKIFGLRLQ